jgi:hypothetical protein
MGRLTLRVLSATSFIVGVIGWITLPDDAALWPARLRPIFMAIGRDDIIAALFAFSALGFAWTLFAPGVTRWIIRRRMPPLSIHFHPIANQPQYNTRFRQSHEVFGALGEGLSPLVYPSIHQFYIAVTNNMPTTIRNVVAMIRYIGVPGWITPIELRLLDDSRTSDHIDISPRQSVRFFLGEILRTEPTEFRGSMSAITRSEDECWQYFVRAEQQQMYGLIIHHKQGRMPLLRNDGTIATLTIYGDNVGPSFAVLRLDMKGDIRITLWQTRRELTQWPEKRDIIITKHELG